MSCLAEIDPATFAVGPDPDLVLCGHCGARPVEEFRYLGPVPADETRDPFGTDVEIWAEALFRRPDARGLGYERWRHRCGLEFDALHDSATGRFHGVRPVGEGLLLDAAE